MNPPYPGGGPHPSEAYVQDRLRAVLAEALTLGVLVSVRNFPDPEQAERWGALVPADVGRMSHPELDYVVDVRRDPDSCRLVIARRG